MVLFTCCLLRNGLVCTQYNCHISSPECVKKLLISFESFQLLENEDPALDPFGDFRPSDPYVRPPTSYYLLSAAIALLFCLQTLCYTHRLITMTCIAQVLCSAEVYVYLI